MNSGTSPLQLKILSSMNEVAKESWDALVPADAQPFLSWDFLQILEESGCVSPKKGWKSTHLSLWQNDILVAAAPAYQKAHSWGEFVYNDFRWPQLTQHFDVRYHPKLIIACPFSPVTAPRLLTHPALPPADRRKLRIQLAHLAFEVTKALEFSSAHLHFGSPEEIEAFEKAGYSVDSGVQYHWENRGEADFAEFLSRFKSKRRHMIRSERRQLDTDGTTLSTLSGEDLSPEIMRFAARCYLATVEKYDFGMHHLNERFFTLLGERLAHRTEVVLAQEGEKWLGSALNFRGENRLYGRWWGAVEDRRFLHFNACYYHSIERCLEQGIQHFEPGAGGEHKTPRGFEPTVVQSAHRFVNPEIHQLLALHLREHRELVENFVSQERE